jgi:hypothetical protein
MPFRAIAIAVIVGLSVMLFVAIRKDNRADAAAGNCMHPHRALPRPPSANRDTAALQTRLLYAAMGAPVMVEPSPRKLVGIALILLLIGAWATFVASLARVVGGWPILVQAPFYLVMGIIWIVPLKPLVRWIQTGSFRTRS